jgi:flagellar biosynthetic protein FlhB
MADNEAQQYERTEQPTAKRLEDARTRSQVPRSRELNMTVVMLAGAAVLLVAQPFFSQELGRLLELGLRLPRDITRDGELIPKMLAAGLARGLLLLAPLWIAVLAATFAGPAAFGGWAFSFEALAPKLGKLNPLSGLKRVFGWTGLVELAKALAKFLLVAIVAVVLLWQLTADLLSLGTLAVEAGLGRAARVTALAFVGFAATLAVIAAADVPFQYWQHRRQLRMTKQELKDEQKETDGKPEVRSRIRSAQQEMSKRRMMADVPKADVVIVNPTHFAVALSYDAATMKAPRVLAKGADLIALNIRRIAEAHRVPVFEHPPFARALYYNTTLGQDIPPRLYVAVAQVLTYVYQLDGRLGRKGGIDGDGRTARAQRKPRSGVAAGGGARWAPRKPDVKRPDIEIDPELLVPPGGRRLRPEADS